LRVAIDAKYRPFGADLTALLDAQKIPRTPGSLGSVKNYETFLGELEKVWQGCYRALVPGGRLVVCVVGDG
jgi:hypothetical protein